MKRKKRHVKGHRKAGRVGNPYQLPVLEPHAAGIDLGAYEHHVAAPPDENGNARIRVFGTTTPQLFELADWLAERGVTTVAMEATGVYWIPLFEILDARGFEVILVNARQLSRVPGRKTDFLDCQWLQLLHSCGLLNGSYRPPDEICRWRALLRERQGLVAQRADCIRRMQKHLDQMNIRLHHAVSDITGATGMAILRAIVGGERNPEVLARLRDRRCRHSEAQIAEYLTGHWRDEHLFNLRQTLVLYDHLSASIAEYDREIYRYIEALQPESHRELTAPRPRSAAKARSIQKAGAEPLRQALYRLRGVDLTTIDGISCETAAVVLSELGLDLSAFPDERHFVSYLRGAPRVHRSGTRSFRPKSFDTPTRVFQSLRMSALTLRHSQSALGAYFRRIARRKGASVAVFATARKLAQLIYRLLRYGQPYLDIGAQAYEARFRNRRLQRYTESLKAMGYRVVPLASVPQTT